MDKKKLTTLAVLIVVVLLGVFGWQKWQSEETGPSLFTEEPANPFEASANPYKDIKTNPFE